MKIVHEFTWKVAATLLQIVGEVPLGKRLSKVWYFRFRRC